MSATSPDQALPPRTDAPRPPQPLTEAEALAASKAGKLLYRQVQTPNGRVVKESVNLERRGLKAVAMQRGLRLSGRQKKKLRRAIRQQRQATTTPAPEEGQP